MVLGLLISLPLFLAFLFRACNSLVLPELEQSVNKSSFSSIFQNFGTAVWCEVLCVWGVPSKLVYVQHTMTWLYQARERREGVHVSEGLVNSSSLCPVS